MVIIRKMNKDDDRLAISHVYEESWKYAYKGIIPQEYLDDIPKGNWVDYIDKQQQNTLVLIKENTIIGTASYCKSRYSDMLGFGEIVSIYLLPEYIGKGLGNRLLSESIKELESLGFSNIFLWVLEENYRARKFYEKNGFKPSNTYLEDNIGGKDLREIQYEYHKL